MRSVDARSVFKCDYTNKDAVIALAKRFGKGMTVFEHMHKGKVHYGITHTEVKSRWENHKVICHV